MFSSPIHRNVFHNHQCLSGCSTSFHRLSNSNSEHTNSPTEKNDHRTQAIEPTGESQRETARRDRPRPRHTRTNANDTSTCNVNNTIHGQNYDGGLRVYRFTCQPRQTVIMESVSNTTATATTRRHRDNVSGSGGATKSCFHCFKPTDSPSSVRLFFFSFFFPSIFALLFDRCDDSMTTPAVTSHCHEHR